MGTHLLAVALCGGLLAAWPNIGEAQVFVPDGELFVGKSEVWIRSSNFERQHGAYEASITGNFNRFVGLEFDFKYPQKQPVFYEPQKIFLGGPHFAYRRSSYVNPFVHILLGVAHGKRSDPNPLRPQHSIGRWVFVFAAGGGIDVKVTRLLWIRAVQADYLRQSLPVEQIDPRFPSLGFTGGLQNNVTLSFGAVFRFGNVADD